jgi:8-oxo-dGTP diphosphatase
MTPLMNIRQVFTKQAKEEEEPDYFQFCPHCSSPMAPRDENGVMRKYCPACGYIQYRNPLPGVAVLIIKDGKILLGKRGPASFRPGTWCLPGGFIEFDEDFITAARREVLEETGLEIEVESIINVASNFLSSRLHSLVVVFQASVKGGTLQAGDDLEALEWFPLEGDLPEMAFESDVYLIRRFAAEPISGIPAEKLSGC